MTDSDNELFELCKQVYERTGWNDTQAYFYDKGNGNLAAQFQTNLEARPGWWWYDGINACPLYTSDYILEKLPNGCELRKVLNGYCADPPPKLRKRGLSEVYEAPIVALLKLTIALHEAGELK